MTGSAAGGRVVRAVLLDVDDTLVDTRASFRTAVRQMHAARLPPVRT